MNINEIVSSGISAEVIVHAGNIRAIMFGRVELYGNGGKYKINSHNPDFANSIIFTEKDIVKIDNTSSRHKIIYISPAI